MKKKLETEYKNLDDKQDQFEKEKEAFDLQYQRYLEEKKSDKYVSWLLKVRFFQAMGKSIAYKVFRGVDRNMCDCVVDGSEIVVILMLVLIYFRNLH